MMNNHLDIIINNNSLNITLKNDNYFDTLIINSNYLNIIIINTIYSTIIIVNYNYLDKIIKILLRYYCYRYSFKHYHNK